MKLNYLIPFTAETTADGLALKEKLINIAGVAIDSSVNSNKWCVPDEDLDFFAESLKGVQLRVDHAESAVAVIGKVMNASRQGSQVLFKAEVGDAGIIEKILRNYLNNVSAQVDSDNVECSNCHEQTRKEGLLVHLCPGAYEIVHKPRVRELSIVASPAYANTKFGPIGFAEAMNASQNRSAVQNLSLGNEKWILKQRLLDAQIALDMEKIEEVEALNQEQLEMAKANLETRLQRVSCIIDQLPKTYIDELRQGCELDLGNAPKYVSLELNAYRPTNKRLKAT